MTRTLQKPGNSKGLVLTRTMLDHLGVTDTAEVKLEHESIVLKKPSGDNNASILPQAVEQTISDDEFERISDELERLNSQVEPLRPECYQRNYFYEDRV